MPKIEYGYGRHGWKKLVEYACPKCGFHTKYSVKYDTEYCHDCDVWVEEKCNDKDCKYCKNRPDKPCKAFS